MRSAIMLTMKSMIKTELLTLENDFHGTSSFE